MIIIPDVCTIIVRGKPPAPLGDNPLMTIAPVGFHLLTLSALNTTQAPVRPVSAMAGDSLQLTGLSRDRLTGAGQRAARLATQVLETFDRWKRTNEGKAYFAWRKEQMKLPESQRSTGTWGTSWGLNGYLKGNKPKLAWRDKPGGIVWKPRCNVFCYNASYQAGFALPGSPTSSILRPDSLAKPFTTGKDPYRVRDYFQQVNLQNVRPGDWIVLKGKSNEFTHVVMATGGFDGQRVPIAQAGGTPQKLGDALRFPKGKPQGWQEYVVIRPTRLRPLDPATGQPVKAPHVT